MGLFSKAKVTARAATGDEFAPAKTAPELKQQRDELEESLRKEDISSYDRARFKTRLDYVNDAIKIKKIDDAQTNQKKSRKKPPMDPWMYPGPIAPVGFKALPQGDGTYSHATSTDPKDQEERCTLEDFDKVYKWAEGFGISEQTVNCHWGPIVERDKGPSMTRHNLQLLQERIRHICKEKNKDMALFNKNASTSTAATTQESPAPPADKIADAIAEAQANVDKLNYEAARERLVDAGMTLYKEIDSREKAEQVLRRRSMAILELGLIYEQFEKGKRQLEQFITDLSTVFDGPLEDFYKKNNPTGKKTWPLQYGDLKTRDKPESIALDTERDPDGSQLQAWLKTQFDKNPDLAKRLKIEQLISYSRDTREIGDWMKEERSKTGKLPPVAGMKVTPAKKDAFSIAPSLDTAKEKIKNALKEKGLR